MKLNELKLNFNKPKFQEYKNLSCQKYFLSGNDHANYFEKKKERDTFKLRDEFNLNINKVKSYHNNSRSGYSQCSDINFFDNFQKTADSPSGSIHENNNFSDKNKFLFSKTSKFDKIFSNKRNKFSNLNYRPLHTECCSKTKFDQIVRITNYHIKLPKKIQSIHNNKLNKPVYDIITYCNTEVNEHSTNKNKLSYKLNSNFKFKGIKLLPKWPDLDIYNYSNSKIRSNVRFGNKIISGSIDKDDYYKEDILNSYQNAFPNKNNFNSCNIDSAEKVSPIFMYLNQKSESEIINPESCYKKIFDLKYFQNKMSNERNTFYKNLKSSNVKDSKLNIIKKSKIQKKIENKLNSLNELSGKSYTLEIGKSPDGLN